MHNVNFSLKKKLFYYSSLKLIVCSYLTFFLFFTKLFLPSVDGSAIVFCCNFAVRTQICEDFIVT